MKRTENKNTISFHRVISLLLTLALVLGLSVAFAGCKDGSSADSSTDSAAGEAEYRITVVSDTGILLEEITVFIYSDDTLADLIAVEETDATGVMSFTATQKEGYVAVLTEVPDGYLAEGKYVVTGVEFTITLTTTLPTDTDRVYKKGDLMYNFNLTDVNGKTHSLSELLKEKDAVVLNFWYISCVPCANEFPYLNEAYGMYSDKLEVIAINPTGDNEANIKSYAEEKGLDFPVVKEDILWQDMMGISAYPTTVVVDRHGRICLVHSGTITGTEEFTKVFEHFTAEDYTQTVFDSIDEIGSEESSKDPEGNPTEVGGVTEFEMTLEPGKTEYCDVYKITNMILTVNSPNALIIYNDEEYRAVDGVVSLYVVAEDTFTPIHLGVGNEGTETETFKIKFSSPEGSSGNPYTLELGDFNTEIAEGNDQGVYYKYLAEKNGTLTVKCNSVDTGVEYDYILYNLDSYAQRSLSADGEGTSSISIDVKKGQTVTVTIGTLPDSSNNYPAASFSSTASFVESEDQSTNDPDNLTEYSVTVKNGEGKGVKGVHVKFEAGSEIVTLTTDDSGYASTKLDADSCTASVTVPDGYTATTTKFTLTKEKPAATASITKETVAKADYTVTVKDKDGKAVKGVLVTVGDSFDYTNASGKVTFNLPVDSYTASISLPDGYKSDKNTFAFEGSKTALTITVTKSSGQGGSSGTQKTTYSVTVKKADGTAVSGVAVSFEKDGVSASVQTTNSSGVATASLEKGNYKAKLAFASGSALNYDKSSTALTASASSITVIVAEPVSEETTELYLGFANHLSLGGNYGKLSQSEDITYFVFVPERNGIYSFTTSYSNTLISYWGANTSFIYDQTGSTDYAGNKFTVTVKDGNLGAVYIIGVKGDEDCVIIVKREGDPKLTIDDLPWTVYKPAKAPVSFSLGLSSTAKYSISYFDVCGKTADYKLVYNETDGYYHLGSKNGDVVYVMLGEAAPYVSFAKLVENTGLKKYFYDANGNFVKKEDYTECMTDIASKMDDTTGLYPLNDDLIYIIKQGGDGMGWWDASSATYLFTGLNGVNEDISWMFALSTIKIN